MVFCAPKSRKGTYVPGSSYAYEGPTVILGVSHLGFSVPSLYPRKDQFGCFHKLDVLQGVSSLNFLNTWTSKVPRIMAFVPKQWVQDHYVAYFGGPGNTDLEESHKFKKAGYCRTKRLSRR